MKIIKYTGLIFIPIIIFVSCLKNNHREFTEKLFPDSNSNSEDYKAIQKSDSNNIEKKVLEFYIGETKVNILVLKKYCPINVLYFNMHENENTSVQAGIKNIEKYGGTLIAFKTNGKREISFSISGNQFSVDPNRIFTNIGIKKTLEYYGNYSNEAKNALLHFTEQFMDSLFKDRDLIIVALHNNTNNNLSINSYKKGEMFFNDAAEYYQNNNNDIDDFIYVTDKIYYDKLKKRNINVVLQNNEAVNDDGSLSVYCRNFRIPYLNIEAEHGHFNTQVDMLKNVYEMLLEK